MFDVTPAEALLLHIMHQVNNGGSTYGEDMDKIKVKGEAKGRDGKARTSVEEVRRLTSKYGHCVNKRGDKIVKLIWPELSPKLPEKFSDLRWNELQYDGLTVAATDGITGLPIDSPTISPFPAK